MIGTELKRGALAGVVGGTVYGCFVALVGTPLITVAETFEEHGHGGAPAVPDTVATITSIGGGVVFGALFGTLVFGLAHYLLDPALPGKADTRSYLLGAFGFVTVSGAPWVALPPRPPGVEAALGTQARLGIYVGMMVLGALACVGVIRAYRRYRNGDLAVALGIGVIAVLVVPVVGTLVPTGIAHSPIPDALAAGFRWTVVFGQVMLWLVLASTHAWLARRADDAPAPAPSIDGPTVPAD